MSDEGRLVAGRYRVIKRIGTGAMGAVWQAQDDVLQRVVAIKQLMLEQGLEAHEAEDARQRTMREGRIAARLHHPNAITVFDVVTDENGQPCLIMEFLDSVSLAQLLQQQRTLPPLDVARIGAQVASALREAHEVGIVHRDIKPGNILLADNGLVKITDFGISRAKDDVTVTKAGMIAGTPAYLAPEVAIGGDPGPESDVFSLGSTLYAAAEGQPPFGLSENTLSLLHAVAAGQINPPKQSGPLTSVLAVMLHPDVAHRPDARQSEDLLDAVSRGETPIGGPTDEATRKQAGPTAALGAAGAGAVGGVLGAQAADALPAGHSGSLDDGALYDEHPADGYGAYADGYGHDDPYYDDYGEYDGYGDYGDAGHYGGAGHYDEYGRRDYAYDDRHGSYADYDDGGHAPTQSVPAGAVPYAADDRGYGDYDDYADYDDGYDGYPPPRDDRTQAEAERGNWKVPAVIGAAVVVGMAAFLIWLFGGSPNTPDAEQDPRKQPGGFDTSTPLSTSSRESSTTTTRDTTEDEPPSTEESVEPPPVEPTDSSTPEPTEPPSSSTPTQTSDPDGSEDPTDGDGTGGGDGSEPSSTQPTEPPSIGTGAADKQS